MIQKIKTVTKKTLPDGKDVWNVDLEDGQKCSCWDNSFEGKEGKELDVVINQKEGSQFKSIKLNVPRAGGFGGGAPRNYRPDALSSAIQWCLTKEKAATTADVLTVAEVFHTWIKRS